MNSGTGSSLFSWEFCSWKDSSPTALLPESLTNFSKSANPRNIRQKETVMNQLKTPQAFVRRFDAVRARLLQVQIARALLRALLVVMAGLALLATVDYLWEAPRLLRQIGLYGLFSGALAVTA